MNKDPVFLHMIERKKCLGFQMKNMKYCMKLILAIIAFGIAIVSIEQELIKIIRQKMYSEIQIMDGEFRAKFYSKKQLVNKQMYSPECITFLNNVENDVSYFPVAESSVDKALKVSYINSWMTERTFGGKRGHEGVDIMASPSKSGLFPVISMTDGVIVNLGWLEKGGYRVGIMSDSGIYYYYAHLESYSNIGEGKRVKAGDLLGYMGDTGYGPEGTKGKFPVHLHVGIYAYSEGKEVSVNPYYILCYLENKKLKYAYS